MLNNNNNKSVYLILAFTYCCCCYYSSIIQVAHCDQPVFVLETSDSEPTSSASSSSTFQSSEQPSLSTHVITDDSTPSNKQSVVVAHQQQQQQQHKEPATVRRLDEATSQQKQTNTRNAIAQLQKQKSTSTTTTTTASPYSSYQQQQQQQPKTEERLLISITSEEDEYKPPKRQVIASTGGFDEVEPASTLSSHQQLQPQQQQQVHKKRPAITISIQDNSNKQGGDSGGTPSVILKPSENGQSIIISTVGSSSIDNNNKYNPNKPAIAIVSSNGQIGHHQNQNHNQNQNNYEQPYNNQNNNNNREPSYPPSSTHRPILVNNQDQYNPPANRPIVSTLVDQPRPPVNIMTQRPPIATPVEDDYDSQRPSTSSSSVHHQRPSTSRPSLPINNNNNNNDYNENTGSGSEFVPTQNSQSVSGKQSKYPLNEDNCGINHETKIVGGDEADPNDFLWMAAIVKSRPTDGEVKPFCGGSLITRRHILTAAHCLEGLAPRDVLVRLGSYDFDDSTASPLANDYAIDQFRKPAQYNKKTHVADIAIMRLKTPLQLSDTYKTVCMPQARRSYVGAYGTVTGYGSQSQTFRRATPKLRQVTVPIWENRKCSTMYKKNLTESFMCAGYEEGGKDACQGDSGGPLMVDGPNSRTIVVGVVSHGIGCGSPGYPGVYTRISTFLDWIEENTRE